MHLFTYRPFSPSIPAEEKIDAVRSHTLNLNLFIFKASILPRLKLKTLKENPNYLEQIALWSEEKWGYIRNFPGLTKRKELIASVHENIYILCYDEQPIGTFGLLDFKHNIGNRSILAKELVIVYLDENFRRCGIGRELIELAKNKCKDLQIERLVLETLNPTLNAFYEKAGGRIVCEKTYYDQPVTFIEIDLKPSITTSVSTFQPKSTLSTQ